MRPFSVYICGLSSLSHQESCLIGSRRRTLSISLMSLDQQLKSHINELGNWTHGPHLLIEYFYASVKTPPLVCPSTFSVSPPIFALDDWVHSHFVLCSHLSLTTISTELPCKTSWQFSYPKHWEPLRNKGKLNGKKRDRDRHTERENDRGALLKSKQIEGQEMHLKSLVFKGQRDRGSVWGRE